MKLTHNMQKLAILSIFCVIWGGVKANDYKWVGADWAKWGTESNWTPEGVPGKDDKIVLSGHVYTDLGGLAATQEIKEVKHDGKSWSNYHFQITNGTVVLKSKYSDRGGQFKVFNDATFESPIDSTFNPCQGAGSRTTVTVEKGGTLNLLGNVHLFSITFENKSGGTTTLNPTEIKFNWPSSDAKHKWYNRGTLNIPNGLNFASDTVGNAWEFIQYSGVMNLGGSIVINGSIPSKKFELQGGKLNITSEASFIGFSDLKLSGTSEIAVVEDVTFDMSDFTVASGATISKSGDGKLIIPQMRGTVAGGLVEAEDYGALTFAGGKVSLSAGASGIPVIPSATVAEGAKIKLALNNLIGIPNNVPQTVIASCPADADLSEIEIDEAVAGSVSIVDGALVFVKTGVAGEIPTKVWGSSAASASWADGVWTDGWAEGSIAKFDSSEGGTKTTVLVDQLVTAAGVAVSGDKDYQFEGAVISAPSLTKTGTGTLTLNNGGVFGRDITLGGGTLVLGGEADWTTATAITIPSEAVATLKGETTSEEGAIVVKLSVGAESKLTIGSTGLELTDDSVIAEDAVVKIDYNNIPTHATFIKCSGDVKTALLAKIAATMAADLGTIEGFGAIGEVIATNDGLAWEMRAVFYGGDNSDITDLLNPDGWRGPVAAPEGESVTIAANAMMTGETPAYGSVTVADEATLTVNATREVNKVTLAADTTLVVAKDGDAANTVIIRDSLTTTGTGTVTVNVAEGCVLDLRGITLTLDARLVKTGAGVILFDQTELANVEIQSGAVGFAAGVTMDMSGITVADGVSYMVSTASGGVRAATKTDGESDTATYTSTAIEYSGAGNWTDAANWNVFAGLPDANDAKVSIVGEGTVAMLNTVESLPSEIDVGDGAELIIVSAVTLPTIKLAPTAKLTLGDGSTQLEYLLSRLPETAVRIENEVVSVPMFTISKNVKLTFTVGDIYFKNVDLRLNGKIAMSAKNLGGIRFGYASNGETAYFKMIANGASIWANCSEQPDMSIISFVYPENGGRVKLLEPIKLTKCEYPTTNGWKEYNNYYIGRYNPVDEPCEIEIDGGTFSLHERLRMYGAVNLKVTNGGSINWGMNHPTHGASNIEGASSIEINGSGSVLETSSRISYYEFKPTEDGHESIRIINGGVYKSYPTVTGNGNAMLRSEDGLVVIPKKGWVSDGYVTAPYDTYEVFCGLKGANIVKDKTLTVVGRDNNCGNGIGGNEQWNRKVSISNLIAGEGDLVVQNDVADNSMEVTIAGAANTCTGEIRCDGVNNAKILFADGANWAGTVVANGAIAFVGEEPTEITVNELKLVGGFKLRFWRDDNGRIIGCDKVNFNTCTAEDGVTLEFDPQGDAAELTRTDNSFAIGSMPVGATLPAMPKGWRVSAAPDPDNADRVLLRAEPKIGFTVVIQ